MSPVDLAHVNKLMNLWGRGLFLNLMVIEVFLNVPVIIIIRFSENNQFSTIYIDIY